MILHRFNHLFKAEEGKSKGKSINYYLVLELFGNTQQNSNVPFNDTDDGVMSMSQGHVSQNDESADKNNRHSIVIKVNN
jgi:hypothetical protein